MSEAYPESWERLKMIDTGKIFSLLMYAKGHNECRNEIMSAKEEVVLYESIGPHDMYRFFICQTIQEEKN